MIVLKEKYLIALDLDGTMLTDDKRITDESKQIIKHLTDNGHIVVIATGRANRLSTFYYQELGLNTPMINSNGAFIHHPLDKKWESYHLPLQLPTAMEVIDLSLSLDAKNVLAAVQDDVYLERFDKEIANFYKDTGSDNSIFIGDLKQNLKQSPTGMLLYPDTDQLDILTNQLDELKTDFVDHRNWGAPFHVIEVMNHSMNKREGLKRVAEAFHIPKNRIIAFGDGPNDLEMIEYAGVGVAMENAIDELKSLASHFTVTNEENGVAKFLNEYFNIKNPIVS